MTKSGMCFANKKKSFDNPNLDVDILLIDSIKKPTSQNKAINLSFHVPKIWNQKFHTLSVFFSWNDELHGSRWPSGYSNIKKCNEKKI